jgi:hypothetical protein
MPSRFWRAVCRAGTDRPTTSNLRERAGPVWASLAIYTMIVLVFGVACGLGGWVLRYRLDPPAPVAELNS